ncbi:hypothetical protein N7492_010334 [Penicillium capsulatum]|uniref:Uncharacterized protein n=1 Tax=Penicillium capsulatum TaxID=69766 RepID=A0A9W9HR42_9EURO|nr:hypothetical protein N7492_010334 [Penicillium capsulatum]KAJ6112839.1 hypothetical protein N7512_008163 [Penicillium capsulatum]
MTSDTNELLRVDVKGDNYLNQSEVIAAARPGGKKGAQTQEKTSNTGEKSRVSGWKRSRQCLLKSRRRRNAVTLLSPAHLVIFAGLSMDI